MCCAAGNVKCPDSSYHEKRPVTSQETNDKGREQQNRAAPCLSFVPPVVLSQTLMPFLIPAAKIIPGKDFPFALIPLVASVKAMDATAR